MLYSTGCEYAIRALARLAGMAPVGTFRLLRDIVQGTDIPEHFLGKVFQELVRAELLVSAKGRGGGFALARPSRDITLRQIVSAIDGDERVNVCILGLSACDDSQPCPQHDRWLGIRDQIGALLDRTTLAELADGLARKTPK